LSDFSPAYIIKLKEKFEKDQMFTMKRDDLKKFFQCSERETDILMQMLDLDGDKTIDSHEFVCALGMLAHGTMD
jgi:Ca2+-binding EF-hand superfamily protein